MEFPRMVIAALRGGSGKTILSIGIIAAWKAQGLQIAPFKKGPDYIDAGWLALAAGRPCYNLDTYLLSPDQILSSFVSRSMGSHAAVIEGNRGLYDGIDLDGTTSTAELAKQLKAPVVLCLDCTKTTRTAAALVLGCRQFDPQVDIRGVVLNRVAGSRHECILRRSIEHHCGLTVLGAIPKLRKQLFPERHMGLVPTPEHSWATNSIAAAARMASDYLDLASLFDLAADSPAQFDLKKGLSPKADTSVEDCSRPLSGLRQRPRIGIVMDSAFQFYYPENIRALADQGAETVFVSPLKQTSLPPVDALYIGGGFPETHAGELAGNRKFRDEIKSLAEAGLPIYAECGGLMYLGEALVLEGTAYPMVGLLPIVFGFSKKPQGHGYTRVAVEGKNPYFAAGTELKGHEFHYSRVLKWLGDDRRLVFSMKRGIGIHKGRDGICYKNVLATYTHIHALGTPFWAAGLVGQALSYAAKRGKHLS